MSKHLAIVCAALIGFAEPAAAQSLFGQPAAPEQQPQAEAAPARKPRPKPRGPTPAKSLTITNASGNTLTALEVTAEGKTASLAKPLASNGRATLKLPTLKGCMVTVSASFEGSGEAEASDYNVCKEKSIRFTE